MAVLCSPLSLQFLWWAKGMLDLITTCFKLCWGVFPWHKGARDTKVALWVRNNLLPSRELHVYAAHVPIVQMLPDSELADAALQSSELCCTDTATVTAVKCRRPGQLQSWDRLLSVCWLVLRDRGTETLSARRSTQGYPVCVRTWMALLTGVSSILGVLWWREMTFRSHGNPLGYGGTLGTNCNQPTRWSLSSISHRHVWLSD